ncbi:hypothetical protein JCM3765_001950 [Sporobolomyces pararoseus]
MFEHRQHSNQNESSSVSTSQSNNSDQLINTASEDNNLPPPRLPSISSLLNSIPPPLAEQHNGEETPTNAPEHRSGVPGLAVERTESPASIPLPPPPPSALPPPPSDYHYQLPYENATKSPNEGGSPHSAVPPTNPSQNSNQNFANRSFYASASQQVPVFDSYDNGAHDPHRQRSSSFNTYPPYPPPSQSLPYGRPYPGFATSSERRSSGSDERGMSHGGLGPWRNRRRGAESPYDANGLPLPPPLPQQQQPPPQQPQHPHQGHWLQPNPYSPTRPRALSISAADEYYATRPVWSSIPPSNSSMGPPPLPLPQPPPLQHHLNRQDSDLYPVDYLHRPFPPTNNNFNRHPPFPAGVSNDFSYLRLTPGADYPRNHLHAPQPQQTYIPPALPIPPPLAQTPIEAHPDLRPIVLPNGLAGSAPSSAGSASASQYSSQSGTGLPTPASAGSSIPSPNVTATAPFDMNGSNQMDPGGGVVDASGSSESGKYCCPHCSKRFARPSSLRIHTFSHTGEKPFTCPQCERAFSVQSNLRRHLKIHKNAAEQNGGGSGRGRGRSAAASSAQSQSTTNGAMEDDEDQDAEGERDE